MNDRSQRFVSALREQIVNQLGLFEVLTNELAGDPFSAERARLKSAKKLIQEGLDQVDSLPDP